MQDYRTTMKPRAHALRPPAPTPLPDIEEDERYYRVPASSRSAIRYTTGQQEIIQQGNRRLHIHYEKPPRRRHWAVPVGLGMMAMLLLFLLGTWATNAWQQHQLDSQYGNPRTWQVDEVVGHDDSTMHPTHFIFMNLNARVVIIELPGGDVSHARIYSGPHIFGDDASSIPVTGEFRDVNGDGRLDLIVHVGTQSFVYLNDGAQFKPQQQEKYQARSDPRPCQEEAICTNRH